MSEYGGNHLGPIGCLSFHSTVPDHAHFVCESLDAAVRLASEPPLADLIEIIWIVGGAQVYKVMQDTRVPLLPKFLCLILSHLFVLRKVWSTRGVT